MSKKEIIWDVVVFLLVLIACWLFCGCSQRLCEYDPTTGVWRYKSNSFATDSRADRIAVTTPSGVEISVDKVVQNNDSVKGTVIIGGIPIKFETFGEKP